MAWRDMFNKTKVIKYGPEMQGVEMLMNNLSRTIRALTGGQKHGVSPDGSRNYNQIFGYGEELGYSDYFGMYKRGGIAKVIVNKVAKACWRDIPELFVGEKRVLKDEVQALIDTGIINGLERGDRMNRIGSFSVVLIGVPDGMDLDKPVGSGGNIDDSFAMPYNEDGITIRKWDNDPTSKRFGMPELYQVQTIDHSGSSATKVATQSRLVHWTRIVHMAEDSLDSEFEGSSALEAPWNCLIDKEKVRGGAGEAYFRNARRLVALVAREGTTIDTPDKEALKTEVEAFTNGWQDFLRLKGMDAKTFDSDLTSPRDAFEIVIEEISGITGIPIRILLGKGSGQLAGAEDRASWNSLVADRQDAECTGWLLRTLQILEEAGLLGIPDGMRIVWPVQEALTAKEQAEVTDKKASAFQSIVVAVDKLGEDVDLNAVAQAVGLDGIKFDQSDAGGTEVDDDGDE